MYIVVCPSFQGGRVTDCLICAGRLDSNNNKNLDTEQMMFIEHKCKFSRLGCEVRIKEDDDINKLHHHEKKCSNRAITCPRVEYKKEVAMIKFEEHAIENNCIDHWDDIINGHCPEGNDFEWPYGYYEDLNPDKDIEWKLPRSYVNGVAFYIFFHYLSSEKAFFHCMILTGDIGTASKYKTKMYNGKDSQSSRKISYNVPVHSFEDLPDVTSSRASSYYRPRVNIFFSRFMRCFH